MKLLLIATLLLTGCNNPSFVEEKKHTRPMFRANCFPLTGYTCAEIVEAIGKTENSKRHPYGIMIKTNDPWGICMNTVNHNVMQYVKEGEQEKDFIKYLSRRYCPYNSNVWERNVKYFLSKIKRR